MPRRRKRSQKKRSPRGSRPNVQNKKSKLLSRLIEGQVNPFSVHARGSKQFDESSAFTNTSTIAYHTTASTDANGALAFVSTFIPSAIYREATTIVSDAVTVNGSYVTSNDTTYIETHTHMRVVSYGVRIYCIANADKAQGILRIATTSSIASLASFETSNSHTTYIPIETGMDVTWCSKPLGHDFHSFIAPDASVGSMSTAGTMPCTVPDVFVSGGPASTGLLGIEVRINYELRPDETDVGTYRHATPSFPHNPSIAGRVISHLTNSPHVQETAELATGAALAYMAPKAATAAASAASSASTWYSSLLGIGESVGETAIEMAPLALL